MRISKKIISGILIVLLSVSFLNLFQLTDVQASSNMTLTQLQQKFPDGAYWNHAGSSINNPDGYTWTSCTHHDSYGTYCDLYGGCECNSYSNAIQCHGFALKLAYDAYGSNPRNWGQASSVANIKAGDVIRYAPANFGHSIFVTSVSGDVITYVDCNWNGPCMIKWNKITTKSEVQKTLQYVLSAPYAMNSDSFVNLGDSFSARIRHNTSGKVLTNYDNSDVRLNQMTSDLYAKQIWKFTRNSDGSYRITSSVKDVSMDLDGIIDADGTNIKLLFSYDTDAQKWFIYQREDGTYYFRSACSDYRVFDLAGGIVDNGTNLQLYTSNHTDAQKFYIDKCDAVGNVGDDFAAFVMNADCWKPITVQDDNQVYLQTEAYDIITRQLWHFTYNEEDGSYFIQSYHNNGYLDVKDGVDANGTPIQVWQDNGDLMQRWFVIDTGNGYVIKSAMSDRVMDLAWGSTEDGTRIQICDRVDNAAQKFSLYKLDSERDAMSYTLIADSASIDIGEKLQIKVSKALYAIDTKLHIISPSGKSKVVNLGVDKYYDFSGDEKGIYKIYAEVTSPVSHYIGSETDRCMSIAVGYDYEKAEELSSVYNGHLYQLIKREHVNWAQAKQFCEQQNNSYLASITSAKENQIITELVEKYSSQVYLGGVRKNETEFRWTDASGDSFTYSNWADNEPNNTLHALCQLTDPYGEWGKENYIVMYTDGLWNDAPIYLEYLNAFIMESEMKDISVSQPTKLRYVEGEMFDKDSIIVEAIFSDGSKRVVDDYTVQGFNSEKIGKQEVTIAYYGCTQSFVVEIQDSQATINPFSDVAHGQYYYAPVLWAVKERITEGYTATTFAPNMACTRGQVVTFLWRVAGQPKATTTQSPFTDVAINSYYHDAVLWAVENGITDGWTVTQFAPEMECTRGQIVTFLWRAAGQPNVEVAKNPFTDVVTNAYYYDAVLWALDERITDGWTATQFAPEIECTRGQIVTFLYRYYKLSIEEVCQSVADYYNDIYNTNIYVCFSGECMETKEGYSVILRRQNGNAANILVGWVSVNANTGEVKDDWGNQWFLV